MPDRRQPVDLRSDTVTRPTPDMRRAMADAEVGDDVFGDDPTVNRLQNAVAELLGKEDAIFVPSGTMANQLSIQALTEPGDEIIAHKDSHVYHYEGGAPAALAGCMMHLLEGRKGQFSPDAVSGCIRPDDSHFPHSALVVIENTHNRGGGTCWPVECMSAIRVVADRHDLRMHLDGARLMNACVATGIAAVEYARFFDTVSICFSKGLGAPVGSAVAGSKEVIHRIHRYRKMYGGGMRQAGIIAAGALYALQHHVERLAEDHTNARKLAEAVTAIPGVSVDLSSVETNIVYFEIDANVATAQQVCDELREDHVWMLPIGPQRIRAVTSLEVTTEGIDDAIESLTRILSRNANR